MKTAKTTLRALLLAAAAAAVMVALASCPNPVADLLNAEGWGLLGTWVAPDTGGSMPGYFVKLTVRADGTFHAQDLGGAMYSQGTYVVDEVSVSGNSRAFKIHYTFGSILPYSHHYVLAIVTDGTSYESNYSSTEPYPPDINTGMGHLTATLQ